MQRRSKITTMMAKRVISLSFIIYTLSISPAQAQNVIDEVLWVVGDEAIMRSDVEGTRQQALLEGQRWNGDPDCRIPEQLAVQKLFLHQAAIDSIEVSEDEITSNIDQRMEMRIQQAGSREKLEEWGKATISEMRAEMREPIRDMMMIQRMKQKLVEKVTVTPAEVRRFFSTMSEDSIPYVPVAVEVEILTQQPPIEQEEIDRIKNELREYTERVNNGETSFATLARMYSEDPGSARFGGEMDYVGRGMLDPAFAGVAFNLTDPKKISKIVQSEFGYHIIQLIDRRGDKVKLRHILRKPQVSQEAIDKSLARLDSIRNDIIDGVFTFEEGALHISDDKETRNNYGLMANTTETERTSRFRMQDLPSEVARAVDTMKVGEISKPFQMINNNGKTTCAIVKLKNRIEGHKATITEDFQLMKDIVENKRKEEVIRQWVIKKIKNTYTRLNEQYKDCDFEYSGWIK